MVSRKAQALRQLYQGKTVGILPGQGGSAPSWLVVARVDIQELTWQHVLDPNRLSAAAIAVILNAGGDEYVQSLKADADVDRALQRYLGGEPLVSLACRRFVSYYHEESGSAVVGLPIAGTPANLRDDLPGAPKAEPAPTGGRELTGVALHSRMCRFAEAGRRSPAANDSALSQRAG